MTQLQETRPLIQLTVSSAADSKDDCPYLIFSCKACPDCSKKDPPLTRSINQPLKAQKGQK